MADGRKNLKPFTGADDPRRQNGRGRPTKLSDPKWVDLFAQQVVNGLTNQALADEFQIGERTVRTYKRDQRVKNAALKLVEDRVIRVTRKVDAVIEDKLKDAGSLDIETLLKIRKEFLGGALRIQTEGGKPDAATQTAMIEELEDNPDFAEKLAELVESAKDPAAAEA